MKVKGKRELSQTSGEQKSFSDAFSSHGSYTLDLERCYTLPLQIRARQRRSLDYEMDDDMKEEGLIANFNKSKSLCALDLCIVTQ